MQGALGGDARIEAAPDQAVEQGQHQDRHGVDADAEYHGVLVFPGKSRTVRLEQFILLLHHDDDLQANIVEQEFAVRGGGDRHDIAQSALAVDLQGLAHVVELAVHERAQLRQVLALRGRLRQQGVELLKLGVDLGSCSAQGS